MKISKILVILAGGIITLSSCGSKGEEKETTQVEVCPCSELIELNNVVEKRGKAYTGSCEELDQHSVATKHQDFVNGKLVAHYNRKRVGDKYVTYDSLTWESGSPYNGFRTTFEGRANVSFISSVKEFKDGKCIFDGKVDFGDNRFYYYDYVDSNRRIEDEGTGNFKEDLIVFLEKLKTVNPRFKFTVDK